MARLCPSLPLRAALNVGEYAELDLLQTLERGLPDVYTLFHSVDWSRGTEALEQHGEIDIVVVNQAGDALLMEVKSGAVEFQPRRHRHHQHAGRERPLLQRLDRLGPWTLRHFTGQFDAGGEPIWTDGQLLIDSVRRFKGQAVAAVVLTECDLAQLDTMNCRLLFVGLTRARVHLEWVVSGGTSELLAQTL